MKQDRQDKKGFYRISDKAKILIDQKSTLLWLVGAFLFLGGEVGAF
jgi:hypothetical protein